MQRDHKDFSQIYDLLAMRVMVDSVKDCCGVLGVVHSLWKPLPGRFKDFIAMPKSNGYQSLHTTVISHSGEPIEIQIRTFEMHRIAEFGVAAHWAYKEGTEGPSDQKLAWLRLLMEWQKEVVDAESFVDAVRVDLFQDEVFVFSPKGDVYNLPAGSTPVDFAYRVHTEVGHRCLGGKVNGRMVPLDYELKNGEIVEILTTKAPHGPAGDDRILRSIRLLPRVRPSPRVLVRGERGVLTRLAPCCQPVPGDAIVGYTTRGKGVTVHRCDCVNAIHAQEEARVVPVDWDS